MFEFVRTHTRLLQFLLLLLILPSFVVFGIQGYSRLEEGGNKDVAVVDGQAIKQSEWDAAHQQQVQRVRQQMPNVDAKLFDTPAARTETLDGVIRDRVLATAVDKLHIGVSDARLQRLFLTDPQFAMLRNADGSVNKELLAAQGMTSESFAARLRQDLSVQQVTRGLTDSAMSSPALMKTALDSLLQRREVKWVRFDVKDYLTRVNPTPAEVEAYYKAHLDDFKAPEQANIEYVVLDLEVLKRGIVVPEADLQQYYSANISRYTIAEERRARHILVKADKSDAPDIKQKAKTKAEDLLAQARKNPAGFSDLAKKHSDDAGTAPQGGDLDFFGRGAMAKPFEDASYALKPGEISQVIESDFGFHVIVLDELRGGQTKPFAAVRGSIEDDVRKQLATKKWAEAAEQFTNTVYEQADSLQPVIDKLKLSKLTATVQRNPTPGAKGPLGSAKLLESIFGSDSIKNKRNTDAVEISANQLASARVVQHLPARVLPLDEVKARVLASVKNDQAAALARADGSARLSLLRSATPGDLANQGVVSRNRPEGLDQKSLEAVLKADASKLPTTLGVDLAGQGYLVARIDKVMAADLPADQLDGMRAQFAQVLAQAESQAYLHALKARFGAATLASAAAMASSAASR